MLSDAADDALPGKLRTGRPIDAAKVATSFMCHERVCLFCNRK